MFNQLERKIKGLLISIKTRQITPEDSRIGTWINKMKEIDEPCYEKLLKEYKQILAGLQG